MENMTQSNLCMSYIWEYMRSHFGPLKWSLRQHSWRMLLTWITATKLGRKAFATDSSSFGCGSAVTSETRGSVCHMMIRVTRQSEHAGVWAARRLWGFTPVISSLQQFHCWDGCHFESHCVVMDNEDGLQERLSERRPLPLPPQWGPVRCVVIIKHVTDVFLSWEKISQISGLDSLLFVFICCCLLLRGGWRLL